jgi:phenylacetic acid degradation operon negative regulatory protein
MGIEEKAARQALSRASSEGLMTATRVGRRTRRSLTDPAFHLLEDGARRIYGFMRDDRVWDGRWLVLVVKIPETQREVRHRLRTRLTWAGMGSPVPGVWVLPYTNRSQEIANIVKELNIESRAMSWVGESGSIGNPEDVVADAWSSLGDVEAEYAGFVDTFTKRSAPRNPEEFFIAQVELVQAWRRFPFIDPALPAELLEHDWPGPQAAKVFHQCHDMWQPQAQEFWRSLLALGDA